MQATLKVIPHKHFQVLMKDNHFLKVISSDPPRPPQTSPDLPRSPHISPRLKAGLHAKHPTSPYISLHLPTLSLHLPTSPYISHISLYLKAGLHAKHVLSKKEALKVTSP